MSSLRFLLLLSLLIAFNPATARHLAHDIEPGSNINEITLPLTKLTAAELAHIETNGKVLSVDEDKKNGHLIYKVKVLHNNGKVKIHKFDSRTDHSLP